MARYRPVFVHIWEDPIFEKYSNDAKVVFLYLITNSKCSESGIYYAPVKRIAFDLSMDMERIADLIKHELQGNTDTLEGNVFYDWDTGHVFIKNFLKYNRRGSPTLITKCVTNDYSTCSTSLWKVFGKCYKRDYQVILSFNLEDRSSFDHKSEGSGKVCKECGGRLNDSGICTVCLPFSED